ncbi:hypothetical protein AGLY_012058 [Aphis glycines]|uniref:Uncharacterized protein n=1 Tax=Aphis glycines TaxID=307491 RepID=A0A6G0T901_APHGL|nr:hypothetical protein AGLY_012058 [Aphis glycines]
MLLYRTTSPLPVIRYTVATPRHCIVICRVGDGFPPLSDTALSCARRRQPRNNNNNNNNNTVYCGYGGSVRDERMTAKGYDGTTQNAVRIIIILYSTNRNAARRATVRYRAAGLRGADDNNNNNNNIKIRYARMSMIKSSILRTRENDTFFGRRGDARTARNTHNQYVGRHSLTN